MSNWIDARKASSTRQVQNMLCVNVELLFLGGEYYEWDVFLLLEKRCELGSKPQKLNTDKNNFIQEA